MDESLPASPAQEITVTDLDALIVRYFDTLQKDKVVAEAQLTAVNKEIMSIEGKLVAYLKALNRKNYQHPRGTVGISAKWRVGMPANDLDKAALFSWLKEQGIYDKLATVNSASLNSLWNQEREAAIKADPTAALTFNLPGLPAPKMFEALTKRRGGEADSVDSG